jgi:hypothetical protein
LLEKKNNGLTKIPELPQQSNHNDCFIEAHNKILDEQQAANESINHMRKERTTNRALQAVSSQICLD